MKISYNNLDQALSVRTYADANGNFVLDAGELRGLSESLYDAENKGRPEPSGSQDMIGLIYPGVNRLDYDAAWADKHVRQWHADDYQAPVLARAGLIDAARRRDWKQLPAMLAYLTSDGRDEITATGLVRLLHYCNIPDKWPVILKLLKDPSPLIRASAADSLTGHLTPESISALAAAATDDYRLVRTRAAMTLSAVPASMLPEPLRAGVEKATADLLANTQGRTDDPNSHAFLGNFLMNRSAFDQAAAAFERAIKLQPENIPALVNVSLAYNALGQNSSAEKALRQALKYDPASSSANFNLALLLCEMGHPEEAESALRTALKADPTFAAAAYNLGVLLAKNHPEESRQWCRKAYELDPQDPKYGYTLAFYLRQQQNLSDAIATLRDVVARHPDYQDAYLLLAGTYEAQGDRPRAVAIYRQFLSRPGLSPQDRDALEAKIQSLQSH